MLVRLQEAGLRFALMPLMLLERLKINQKVIAFDNLKFIHNNINLILGVVIGIDKLQIYPIDGATFLGNTDFTSLLARKKLMTELNGRRVDCVLSDMAPSASGIQSLDQDSIMELAQEVLIFAKDVSVVDGALLIKVWENGALAKFEKELLEHYKTVKHVKPNASRMNSAEKFILARGFRNIV